MNNIPSVLNDSKMTEQKETVNYCLKDYTHEHHWENVGIDRGMIIYQCTQCRKCVFEEIRMIGRLL